METILYSWLATTAAAPLVIIFAIWNLIVFRKYRSMWSLVDLFLISLSSQEVVSSLFAFGFAVLSLIKPALEPPCSFIVWGLIATRVFQLSVLTSLLLDRALATKRPFTYRLSVRRNQLRYHIIALSVIALFVGMTAVFARVPNSNSGVCSIHPLAWDVKFSIFLTSVYCMLLFTGVTCCLMAHIGRTESQRKCRSATTSRESKRSASTSNSSQQVDATTDSPDVEWKVITCVSWLSLVTNHGPFLVMTITGIAMPTFWSQWLDNITVWMRLFQGASFPFALLLTDTPHRSALQTMLRQPGRIYRYLPDYGVFRKPTGNLNSFKPDVLPSLAFSQRDNTKSFRFPVLLPNRLRWKTNHLTSLASLNTKAGAQRLHQFQPLSINSFNQWSMDTLDSHSYISVDSLYTGSHNSMGSDYMDYFFDTAEDARSITTDAIDDFEYMAGISDGHAKFGRRHTEPEQIQRTSATQGSTHFNQCFSISKERHLPSSMGDIDSNGKTFAIPRSKMANIKAAVLIPERFSSRCLLSKESDTVDTPQGSPCNNRQNPFNFSVKKAYQYNECDTYSSSDYVSSPFPGMPIFTIGENTELHKPTKCNSDGDSFKNSDEKLFKLDDLPMTKYLNIRETSRSNESIASVSNLKTPMSSSTLSSLDNESYSELPTDVAMSQRVVFSGYL